MRIKILILLLLFVFTGTFFYSCNKTTSQLEREEEIDHIQKYVKKYLPGIKPTTSGLFFQELKPGFNTTDTIKAGDIVKVYYSGYLIDATDTVKDGAFFDGTGDYLNNNDGNYEPYTFIVGGGTVIQGWDEAIRLMYKGEVARWVLPSRLAYSTQGTSSGIPAYSPLVFYITVVDVKHPATYDPPIISKQPF